MAGVIAGSAALPVLACCRHLRRNKGLTAQIKEMDRVLRDSPIDLSLAGNS